MRLVLTDGTTQAVAKWHYKVLRNDTCGPSKGHHDQAWPKDHAAPYGMSNLNGHIHMHKGYLIFINVNNDIVPKQGLLMSPHS